MAWIGRNLKDHLAPDHLLLDQAVKTPSNLALNTSMEGHPPPPRAGPGIFKCYECNSGEIEISEKNLKAFNAIVYKSQRHWFCCL